MARFSYFTPGNWLIVKDSTDTSGTGNPNITGLDMNNTLAYALLLNFQTNGLGSTLLKMQANNNATEANYKHIWVKGDGTTVSTQRAATSDIANDVTGNCSLQGLFFQTPTINGQPYCQYDYTSAISSLASQVRYDGSIVLAPIGNMTSIQFKTDVANDFALWRFTVWKLTPS